MGVWQLTTHFLYTGTGPGQQRIGNTYKASGLLAGMHFKQMYATHLVSFAVMHFNRFMMHLVSFSE